jgi:hypothetical protein
MKKQVVHAAVYEFALHQDSTGHIPVRGHGRYIQCEDCRFVVDLKTGQAVEE